MARRRAKGDRLPSVEDVLAGRAQPRADVLFRLIHEVNPTGAGLAPGAEAARYAQKAALQSLLIRHYPEMLTVRPDPRSADLVLLQRPSGGDACHARVSALDAGARAWVDRQLAPEPPAAPTGRAPAIERRAPDGDLVARGRAALAEYDYEAAQAHFEAAVAARPHAVEPALALLELLVHGLAADEEALGWSSRLPEAVAAEPAVRALLAQAAARAGREPDALRLARDLDPARQSEIRVLLCERALADGRLADAERLLDTVRGEAVTSAPGVSAAVVSLTDRVRGARAVARAPAEAELARLHAESGAEAALPLAQDILASWPESAPAAAVVAEVEASHRAHRVAALCRRADEEQGRGRFGAAAALLREAVEQGGDPDALNPQIEALAARARDELLAAQIEAVAARLRDAPDDEALLLWLGLDGPSRAAVRDRADHPALAHLHALDAAGIRAKEAVRAARALEEAAARLPTEPDAVLAVLARHTRALRALPLASRIEEDAQRLLAARRQREAAEALAAAAAALAVGDLPAAEAALQRAGVPEHPDHAELTARLAAARDRRRLDEALAAARATGDPFAVRRLLCTLAALDGTEPPRDELAALEAESARRWPVTVYRDLDQPFEPRLSVPGSSSGIYRCMTADGRTAYIALGAGEMVFIHQVDMLRGRLTAVAVVHNEVLDPVQMATLDDGVVWVITAAGCLLRIRVPAFTLADRIDLGEVLPPGGLVGGTLQPLDWNLLWLGSYRGSEVPETAQLIDINRKRVITHLSCFRLASLRRGGETLIGRIELNRSLALHHADGTPAQPPRVGPDEGVADAVGLPGTSDLVLLAVTPQGKSLLRIDAAGAVRARHALPVVRWGAEVSLGLLPGDVPLVVIRHLRDRRGTFWLFRAHPEQFEPVWEGPAGRGHLLVDDTGGHLTLWSLDAAPPLQPLSPDAPPAPPAASRPETFAALCGPGCRPRLPEEHRSEAENLDRILLARLTVPNPLRRDRAEALALTTRLTVSPWPTVQQAVGAFLDAYLRQRPKDVDFQVARANLAAYQNEWTSLGELLDAIPQPERDSPHFRHYHHLLALKALATGRYPEAGAIVERALEAPGECPLDALRAVARACAGVPGPAEEPASLGGWLWTLGEADAALERGDGEAAIALLDRPAVRDRYHPQSIGRLAAAWLIRPTADDWDRYRRDAALAAASALDKQQRDDLPIPKPGCWWSDERLAEVAQAARKALRRHHPAG